MGEHQSWLDGLKVLLWRAIKKVLHVVTGKSEVERILVNESVGAKAGTAQLFRSLKQSKALKPVYDNVVSVRPDRNSAVEQIKNEKLKECYEVGSLQTLESYVGNVCGVSEFIAHVDELQQTPFNKEDPTHEAMLEKLWNVLTDNRHREGGRISTEWNIIGFQGKDPASDFRGGGLLSLKQLLYIATMRTDLIRKELQEPANPQARYPWACVGINITSHVTTILKGRVLDEQLYGVERDVQFQQLNELYADLFEYFHTQWLQSNPNTVMDFPPVFSKAMSTAAGSLRREGVLPPC